jgi:hypothetical protein
MEEVPEEDLKDIFKVNSEDTFGSYVLSWLHLDFI